MVGWINEWLAGWMDGWRDGWMLGQMDRYNGVPGTADWDLRCLSEHGHSLRPSARPRLSAPSERSSVHSDNQRQILKD